MDIGTEIDRSFGDGPAPEPIDALLARGHRSLRRRRLATGAAALVLVVVAGGGAWSAAGSGPSGHDSSTPVATDPTPRPGTSTTSDPSQATTPDPLAQALRGRELVALTLDGRLAVRDGVEVLKRVPNPLGYTDPGTSLGLEIRYRGTTYWYLLDSDGEQGTGSIHDEARRSFPTLTTWLDDQVALQTGGDTLALVHFSPGTATLQPLDGVTLVQQRSGVDLGPNFAGPDATTAVAEVRWQGDTWFVLARRLPGSDPEYFPTAASVSAPSLSGFLDYAHGQYAGGAGLR